MRGVAVLALMVAAGLAFASAGNVRGLASSSGGCSGSQPQFDYMYLVQQWPATACKNCSFEFFTMHGNWPTNNDGSYPCDCSSEPFDESKVTSIMDMMDKYWPSYQEANEGFWSHEWSKHGTCSSSISSMDTQLGFFSMTLKARQTYDITSAWANAGITPSDTKTYQASDMQAAGKKAFGATPILSCGYHNEVSEVALCLDKTLSPIECPSSQSQGCTGEVGFPATYSFFEQRA